MSGPIAYFTSVGADTKQNLWVTDGTAAGTHQVAVTGGVAGIAASGYATLNGSVYFGGFDGAGKKNLFRVDGYSAMVTELSVSGVSSSGLAPSNTTAWNGRLYFQGSDASNTSTLWSSDGTAAGTSKIPVTGYTYGFYASSFTPIGTKLAFAGARDTLGSLYLTDGTAAGTAPLTLPGVSSLGNINTMASAGGKLVFNDLNSSFKNALFVSDGTAAGTMQLSVPTLNPTGGYTGRVAGLVSFGSRAAFTAVDASGRNGIWTTDGTSAGTVELPGVYGNSYGSPMAALAGNRLAFIGMDGSGNSGVYITDGTAAGTALLPVAGAAASGLAPHALFAVGNRVYFDGVTTSGVRGLFVSDGTAAGTSLVATGVNLVSGNIDSDAGVLGGTVAYTDTTTRTSGTARADIYSGPVRSLQQQYVWSGNHGVAMVADAPGSFLHGAAGNDALTVSAGTNVLDGGQGSDFLTGSNGADGGMDTFFVDGRGGGVTWSTINNFHHGDAVTLWGYISGTSTGYDAVSGRGAFTVDGAQGYQGATIHSELGGAGTGVTASLTISGMSVADAASKLTLSTGSVEGNNYLYISYTG